MYVDPLLKRWIVDLVRATRELEIVQVGASVRGSLALERVARAWALLHGRPFVAPEDIEALFLPVVGHRLVVAPELVLDEGPDAAAGDRAGLRSRLEHAPRPAPDWDVGGASGDHMSAAASRPFPLVPRRRFLGVSSAGGARLAAATATRSPGRGRTNPAI